MSESADYMAEQCHKDKGTYSQVETRPVRAVLVENKRLREALDTLRASVNSLLADNKRLKAALLRGEQR